MMANPQAFECWLYFTVVYKDAELELVRQVTLPFPPSEGITLQFLHDEDKTGFDFKPHRVVYCVEEDVFWCSGQFNYTANGGCPCTEEDQCCVAKAESKQWHLDAGWAIERERRGRDRHYVFEGMFGERPEFGLDLNPDD
jgi:hypothetical protein